MTLYQQIVHNRRKTALLMVIFVVLIGLLGYVFDRAYGYGYAGLAFALLLSVGLSITGFYSGDKIALWTAGAQGPLEKGKNDYVYNIVENLCISSGLPYPKVYLIPDTAINAFATGRDPFHASIAITQGAIEKLENEELEGVIAHELSHIKNYDSRVMMVILVCVGMISLLSNWFFHARWGRSRSREGGQAQAIFMIAGIVLAILSPIIAELIKLAVSRRREFLADSSAALLTRYPQGLIGALKKIGTENQPLQRANSATAHLYFSHPFGQNKKIFSKLFSTHPPLEDRIQTLQSLGM